MYSLRTDQQLTVYAPAKVNLSLEVLARRADGFHELETLMLAVDVCDTLTIEPTTDGQLSVQCSWACGLLAARRSYEQTSSPAGAHAWSELPKVQDNLVWKALHLLQTTAGVTAGAIVTLKKRIPAQAGLGGASADAAATLLAANQAWQLHWPVKQLHALAAQLGSDVPFFLTQGAAVCRGRGERIEAIRVPRCWFVMVRPPVGLSTPAVFRGCTPEPNRHATATVCAALSRGDLSAAARGMHNGLQAPAEAISPWIGKVRGAFARSGCVGHQMSGSGSSYFGLYWTAAHARRAAVRLRALNQGAVMVAQTASLAMDEGKSKQAKLVAN
ncbi:4-(cytidine 5'-diphospho)-2-C-methyl-D-erythritol kinase [Anatilimnocola sp. NA78]|uniref:4-(cytidine 5'-diphospho)-2-C-methyl-D-erythritol kinase n=1 Tax=Anatilimnocola sp. NA78 TaxID=3415683 RepID=UPI003CE55F16